MKKKDKTDKTDWKAIDILVGYVFSKKTTGKEDELADAILWLIRKTKIVLKLKKKG